MNNEVIVTARKLTDCEERLMFMPKFFGQYWHFVENHTYNWMRKLSPENKSQYLSSALDKIEAHYDGGEWDFYELSNGGYFMAPNSREHYRISVQGNYFDGLLRGLTLSGTKTHVKQRFLPLTPLLMVSDVLWSPVLPA
ncbi:antirestriction protein [Citrobacter freundii]|uniref:antirestriction protein n=1 Tax=Citrobacter freundii TaxID=546 RepID=UPI00292B6DBC|nr:antirestriction protein [Citrobacter freundii]MDV1776613.1 antirestriction protein [Citrobacter freundii]MEB0393201.1 antirestriction protein [Citrobacter freundii]